MKIPFRKIKKDFSFTTLSQPEKRIMLKSINLYMTENPAVKPSFSFQLLTNTALREELGNKNYMIATIIVALLLATSGGTVMAAENSLPGDMLYNVKLNVNEKVMTAMAVSDDAEADVQSKLSERRLQEYNRLLEQKKWSAEKEQQMTDRLKAYQDKTLVLIERLRASGKIELANSIYDRMMAKANSFEEFVVMVKAAYANDSSNQLPERMKEMRQRVLGKDVVGAPEGSTVSVEAHIKNATEAIFKLNEVYETQKATLNDRLKTYLENSLAEARDYLAEAKDKLAAESYREASDLAKRAMQLAVKARSFANMVDKADDIMSENKLDKISALPAWNDGWQVRAEHVLVKAETYATKLKAELMNKESDLSAEALKEARAKIAEAELLITRARTELAAGNYQVAAESAKEAFEKLMEVRIAATEVVATDWRTRADNTLAKAATFVERAKAEITAQATTLPQSSMDRLNAKLAEAEATLTSAKNSYAASKFEEAFNLARRAIEQLIDIKPVEIMKDFKDKEKRELKEQGEQAREELKKNNEVLREAEKKSNETLREEAPNEVEELESNERENEVEDDR